MTRPFVNRIEEMNHLRQALRYDGKDNSVLIFTGIGGMGKTALRIAFEEQVLKPSKVPYAVLDYDGDPNLRPIEATLRAIRRQLGRHKVKTPVFDYLYARYFELSTGLKISPQSCPPELEDVVTILDGIPVVGNVTQIIYGLSRLGLNVRERVQHKEWLYRIRELEPREVLNLLPEVLAEDLEEAMSSQSPKVLKSSGFRIPLLLDAYERLAESQLDDTLHRKLLSLTPHLLRVIFTRAPLPWEHKFAKEWRGKITHFPALEVLAENDAISLLEEKDVDDPDLQDHLYQLTGGYPFHLELCADICREIEETSHREPEIGDFEGTAEAINLTEELVNRLLRQLEPNERDLMGLAAYPRWVSEEILEVLSSVPESVERILKKLTGLSMFSPHPEIPEAYIIRKEVRDCLLPQQKRKRLWKKRHGALAEFHRERWEETRSPHHLREALYHGFYEDAEEAMEIFEGNFWKLLDEYHFRECEGLLEATPVATLNEKQKRRLDFARARLLTSSMQSQESLIAAKNLYESLVKSETDEDALGKYFFSLAENLDSLTEHEKALQYYRKSLATRLKVYGEEHPDTADCYAGIGDIYWLRAKYEKALEYFQKSLAIRLKVLPEEHPDVADSYIAIGSVHYYQHELGKALEYSQKSLATRLKVYGEEHPKVAESYGFTGSIYREQREYGRALEYLQKSLAIALKVYGEEHPAVGGSYLQIGRVYSKRGEYGKALEYLHKNLAIWLKVYGEKRGPVSASWYEIGYVYFAQGEYKMALEYYEKSLAMHLSTFGEEHRIEAVPTIYKDMACTLWALKREEEALQKMRKSVELYHRFERWKETAEGSETLAGWLEERGKNKEAEEARAEARKIRKDHDLD